MPPIARIEIITEFLLANFFIPTESYSQCLNVFQIDCTSQKITLNTFANNSSSSLASEIESDFVGKVEISFKLQVSSGKEESQTIQSMLSEEGNFIVDNKYPSNIKSENFWVSLFSNISLVHSPSLIQKLKGVFDQNKIFSHTPYLNLIMKENSKK